MDFAEKLKALRAEKAWSQSDLAGKASLTTLMISKYETGRATPPMDNLSSLARALGVTADYLIFDDVPRNGRVEVRDVELHEYMQLAQNLDEEDRAALKHVVKALVSHQQANRFAEELGKGPARQKRS